MGDPVKFFDVIAWSVSLSDSWTSVGEARSEKEERRERMKIEMEMKKWTEKFIGLLLASCHASPPFVRRVSNRMNHRYS